MAYDENLAERVRLALADAPDLDERLMFGGIAFMVSGHMACGLRDEGLLVRLGAEGAERALERPGVSRMEFTGRPMSSIVVVDPGVVAEDRDLAGWVAQARAFVATLPPKQPGERAPRRRRRARP